MTNQIVSDTELEECLNWLSVHDELMAEAHASVDKYDELRKAIIAELMMLSGKKSAKEKEAEALSSTEYRQFLDEREIATKKDKLLKLRASYMNTKIDVWRTIQANQRRGQI